ncbi:Nucleolar protein 4 [Liparis tanakae]|uniref:Nucleolar protein 4 n=1 Tax=Liparis tanakae TaxID=230148 RepID=A0A4Z2E0R0_9TELE|nr:Nucleolar protein 4 [Liparis tanakae]
MVMVGRWGWAPLLPPHGHVKVAFYRETPEGIAETYAFLPREAVTRFLMSCGECQKRMHINPSTAEFKGNGTHLTCGGLANSGDIIN